MEHDVFINCYDEFVTVLSNTNLSPHFVSRSIISLTDDHSLRLKTNPTDKADILLKPVATALKIGNPDPFYKMLAIMKEHGNETEKKFANKISHSSGLQSQDLASTSLSSPDATPSGKELTPSFFNTAGEANDEFNVVLSHIARELNAYINQNCKKFESVCYYLTQKVLVLSQEDKKQIEDSKSFTDIKNVLEPHWNWSSHRLLCIIIEKLQSDKSLKMLQNFDEKVNKQMKLNYIHENLQSKTAQSSDYCKMIAILDLGKDYSEITLKEGLLIEEFVFDYLGRTGAHSSKAYTAKDCMSHAFIEMEWSVSIAAVDGLCTKATKRIDAFIKESFLFLKIGNFTVINQLPNETGKPHVSRASLMMVFNDPIHGHIELDPVLLKIIDTPQFQRLRYIKQLSGGYFVFPGASHNRFEHSIGVCYLAGELVETLKTKQPELAITNDDVLCVKMAGLCNNLGCGPFSYMFQKNFIPKARKDLKNWKHQKASVKMFEHLIVENKLENVFKQNDLEFVKDLIDSPKEKNWAATGRTKEKEFLYEIVTNRRNGIDVNKWDYFARDCYHLGITSIFDYRRFMMFARVIKCDGRQQICTRDKEVMNLYDMFYTRYLLHKRAYHHKTVNAIELMICEAFLKANDHIVLRGKKIKLSECIDDMHVYTHLTDHVFHEILLSTNKNLKESREILNKVVRRQLYKYIGRTQPKNPTEYSEEEIVDQIIGCPKEDDLTADDLVVKIVTFDYGMEEKNPIDHVRFYAKDHPNRGFKLKKERVSRVMLLKEFVEQEIRIYCKKRDEASLKTARELFTKWCHKAGYTTSPDSEFDDDTYTPYVTPSKCSQDPVESDPKAPESKKRRLF